MTPNDGVFDTLAEANQAILFVQMVDQTIALATVLLDVFGLAGVKTKRPFEWVIEICDAAQTKITAINRLDRCGGGQVTASVIRPLISRLGIIQVSQLEWVLVRRSRRTCQAATQQVFCGFL